ncbi:hypothetical protein ScPMuIL_005443 [Solemya velum]
MEYTSRQDEFRPFQVLWLDSCYQQTLLPDAPWHKLENEIEASLVQRVEKQFANSQRKEALLHLLGGEFVKKHFPKTERNLEILEPPMMRGQEKQRLLREAQGYLKAQMSLVVKEIGYQSMLTGAMQGETPPPDYADFLEHTFNIFVKGLERELFRQEEELTKNKYKELDNEYAQRKLYRIPVPSRVRPILTQSGSSTSPTKPSSGAVREMVHQVAGDPPPLWGPQSDIVGKSVLAILQRDSRKFEMVVGRLHGRQLPGSLRAYIWSEVLLKAERKKMNDINAEKIVRERFARAVTRGISELRIPRATHSPINGLIETAVMETYSKTTSLVAFKTDEHMKEAIRTLNILYVYDRSYEPYLIHWLFPLQLAFQNPSDKTTEKGQLVVELAMYLDLVNSTCFPTWPEVFAIADQSMKTIAQGDPELFKHLKNISVKNVKVNKKEFLMQLIHGEKVKAKHLQGAKNKDDEDDLSEELLADPLIFMRRWIGEGFVSVLDSPGVMYVWDQCFMQGWNSSVLSNFCLAVLELLRYKFMEATDYLDMKEVFLFEPCKLYTMDIQMAWIHLESGKSLMDIPYLNRQRPITPGSRLGSVPASAISRASRAVRTDNYMCGIKDIEMKLSIPSEAVKREPWIADVDAKNLRIQVGMYFGSVPLQSAESGNAEALSAKKDNYGNTEYRVFFPYKFEFEDLDFTEFDLEREMGAYPYCIIRVMYLIPDPSGQGIIAKPVGWTRIPIFQHDIASHSRASFASIDINWILQIIPKTPLLTTAQKKENILGYNSETLAMVYDLHNEPPGRRDQEPPIPPLPEGSPVSIAPRDTRHTPRHTPRPKPTARPQKSPAAPSPALDDTSPWVEHRPAAAKSNPKPTSMKEPFDLYVDSVRFIPDSASIIKVTGRLFRIGQAEGIEDLLAVPELESSARSPSFKYRLTVNIDKKQMDPGMIIFLRVYTKDVDTDEIKVIGSCLVPAFESQKLRVGGHQYHLHNGMPEIKDDDISNLKHTDMDMILKVPSVSLLIRLLPHTQAFVEAPKYSTGYYKSASCKPNVSETRIFESYSQHMMYPKTVRNMIQRIQQEEGAIPGRTDQELNNWLVDRLDQKKHIPNQFAGNLALSKCVRYRLKRGLKIKINQAYGLPEALYIQCFAHISGGAKVVGMSPTEENYGGDEKFITLKQDNNSFQQAPVWLDDAKELHPFYDDYTCLIIQLFGLDLLYRPKPTHDEPGTVHNLHGQDLDLGDDQILGWTVLPLFSGNAVLTGVHELPLFKGKPPAPMMEDFTKQSVLSVIDQAAWDNRTKFPAGGLTVTLWDGHFEFDEIPEKPSHLTLLEAVGRPEEYNKAKNVTKGKKISNFIVDNLETKYKKQGTTSAVYQKEQKWFDELMEKTFYDLMENALMTAGMGPL